MDGFEVDFCFFEDVGLVNDWEVQCFNFINDERFELVIDEMEIVRNLLIFECQRLKVLIVVIEQKFV